MAYSIYRTESDDISLDFGVQISLGGSSFGIPDAGLSHAGHL